jgi:hypothetical protein
MCIDENHKIIGHKVLDQLGSKLVYSQSGHLFGKVFLNFFVILYRGQPQRPPQAAEDMHGYAIIAPADISISD